MRFARHFGSQQRDQCERSDREARVNTETKYLEADAEAPHAEAAPEPGRDDCGRGDQCEHQEDSANGHAQPPKNVG